jgi:hypothetical protein
LTRWVLLAVLALAALSAPAAPAATIVNGGFESGTLAGWVSESSTGAGRWYPYTGTKSPIPHERGAVSVQAPPQGQHAAIADQLNPDSLLLYQDIQIEPGTRYKLSLLTYYDSYAALALPSPDTLAVDEETIGAQPNQQFRIDLIKPEAPPASVNPGDVLLNLFQTRAGGPRKLAPTPVIGDLAPFAGQTVRLRIAVAATDEVLSAGVDAVTLSAPDGTFASVPGGDRGRLRPGKAKANRKKGTVSLRVEVPEAGRLVASSRSGKSRRTSVQAPGAGLVTLQLRPSRKARAILERRQKLRVGVTLVWRPASGGEQKLRTPVIFKLKKP